ncbi:MAG: trypsin-like serine peptidase [Mangrovibacterium sp.]
MKFKKSNQSVNKITSINSIASRFIVIVVIVCSSIGASFAQIQHGGTPLSFQSKSFQSKSLRKQVLSAINVKEMKALDVQSDIKNRYGVVEDVDLDIKEAGTYQELDGMGVWRMSFSCETAKSLSVYLSTFDIPQEAKLFVYSEDKSMLRGAFTSANNSDGDGFAIAEIKGTSYVLEYCEPLNAEFQGGVVVKHVVKAYLDVEERATPARVGINCDAGDDYQNEKRAVARMTYTSGARSYFCSGSLVSNTSRDGTPYFLTANHCISTPAEAATLITYFNYENSSCSSSDASEEQTISGASLKATSNYTDFTLLELSEMPPVSYQPYFLGWNVAGNIPQKGVAIHHPMGTPKCISIDNDPLTSYSSEIPWDDGGFSEKNTHWMSVYEIGADEGGSSGCPILDENNRIVGQLHGGNDYLSLWGKLSLSWKKNSMQSAQLSSWLDDLSEGVQFIDGYDFYAEPSPEFEIVPSPVCVNSVVTLRSLSASSATLKKWTITPSTYQFESGINENSNQPRLRFTEAGTYVVTCEMTWDGKSYVASKEIEVIDKLNVSFVAMPDKYSVCVRELHNFQLEAEGAYTYSFSVESGGEFFDVESNDQFFTINLNDEGQRVGNFEAEIKVVGTSGDCSSSDRLILRVSAPLNDNVADAIQLRTGINGSYSNVCGSIETNEPFPSSSSCEKPYSWCPDSSGLENALDNSVWFTVVAPDNGYVELTVSGIESQLALYSGNSAADILTEKFNTPILFATADSLIGTERRMSLHLENGLRYYLQVDGREAAEGEFTIEVKNSSASVFPTISTDGVVNVVLPNMSEGVAQLSLISAVGAKVYETSLQINRNQSNYAFNWGFLRPDLYVVHIRVGSENYVAKLLIVGR